jgi:hypothetical protein
MLLSSTRARGSNSSDALGGLRRSFESLVSSGAKDKSELAAVKSELANVAHKLQISRQVLVKPSTVSQPIRYSPKPLLLYCVILGTRSQTLTPEP